MSSRILSLPIWIGSVLCAWSMVSCAQPVDDSGWAGQNPGGGSGGALVGGSAGSGAGGSGDTGGAAGGGGSSFGGAGGNTGGAGGNTGGAGGNTGGTAGNTGGYGNSGGSTGGYGNSGGSTGGGGGDCVISSTIAACDSCLTSQCYTECAVCSANTDCLDLLDCIGYCSGDPYCQDDCSYYYPYGVDDLLALLGSTSGCLALKCATPCQ